MLWLTWWAQLRVCGTHHQSNTTQVSPEGLSAAPSARWSQSLQWHSDSFTPPSPPPTSHFLPLTSPPYPTSPLLPLALSSSLPFFPHFPSSLFPFSSPPSSLSFSTCFCLPLFFPPFVTHSVWYRPSWFRTRQYAPALQRNRGNLISAWLPLWPPVKDLPDAREKAANEWTNVKKRTHLICKMSSLSHLLKAPHVKNYRTTNDESFSYCDLIGCIQPQCTQVNPVLR